MALRHVPVIMAVGAAVVFLLAPMIVVFIQSVADAPYGTFPPGGISLRWFEALAAEPRWRDAALRSALLATAVSGLSLVLGTSAVYALVRLAPPGRSLIMAALLVPLVLPGIVLGIASFLFSARIGIAGTIVPLALAHLALAVPFVVAVLWAAFARVDWSIEEAAIDLGCGRFAAVRHAVIPQIRAALVGAGAFAWLASFDQLETSLFLSSPGSATLPVEMFRQLQQKQDPTVAAIGAAAVLLSAVFGSLGFGVRYACRVVSRLAARTGW
jgi:putative spermidine/putrescine transport system permease protein